MLHRQSDPNPLENKQHGPGLNRSDFVKEDVVSKARLLLFPPSVLGSWAPGAHSSVSRLVVCAADSVVKTVLLLLSPA